MNAPSPDPTTGRNPGPLTFRGLGLAIDPTKIAEVKKALAEEGISAWARRHSFRPKSVHDVLSGKRACIRGESNRIAQTLGLLQSSAT